MSVWISRWQCCATMRDHGADTSKLSCTVKKYAFHQLKKYVIMIRLT